MACSVHLCLLSFCTLPLYLLLSQALPLGCFGGYAGRGTLCDTSMSLQGLDFKCYTVRKQGAARRITQSLHVWTLRHHSCVVRCSKVLQAASHDGTKPCLYVFKAASCLHFLIHHCKRSLRMQCETFVGRKAETNNKATHTQTSPDTAMPGLSPPYQHGT